MPTSPATPRSRQLALLAGVLPVVVVTVAVVVIALNGGGSDRPSPPDADVGAHSDATALAQVVETAVRDPGAEGRAPSPDTTCAAEARAVYGQGLGPLVHAARLLWQDTAAVALTYRLQAPGDSGLDHRTFVLSLDGCRLLAVQSL